MTSPLPLLAPVQIRTPLGLDTGVTVHCGDAAEQLALMPDASIDCCVTSPPYYGLRDYGVARQIGLEKTPQEYVQSLLAVFQQVHRVLKPTGTLWLNLGDSYANDGKWGGSTGGEHVTALHDTPVGRGRRFTGLKPKDLIGIPWMVAFALRDQGGWYLRSDIIWHKPNPMPESVTDRPTRSHEYIFLFLKSQRYYYDHEAIKEPCIYYDKRMDDPELIPKRKDRDQIGSPSRGGGTLNKSPRLQDKQKGHGRRHNGFNDRWDNMEHEEQCSGTRNKRDAWSIAPANFREAHFATFPPKLIEPCILAGCPKDGTVLDPFAGSGTTGYVAMQHNRKAVLIELNPNYIPMIEKRLTE